MKEYYEHGTELVQITAKMMDAHCVHAGNTGIEQ